MSDKSEKKGTAEGGTRRSRGGRRPRRGAGQGERRPPRQSAAGSNNTGADQAPQPAPKKGGKGGGRPKGRRGDRQRSGGSGSGRRPRPADRDARGNGSGNGQRRQGRNQGGQRRGQQRSRRSGLPYWASTGWFRPAPQGSRHRKPSEMVRGHVVLLGIPVMPEVLNWAQARFLSDNRNTVSWVLNRTPPPSLGEAERDRAQIEFADLVALGAITAHHMIDGDSVASVMSESTAADLELPPHVTVVAQASMGGVAAALKLRGACTPELELAADAATTNVEVWDSVEGDALMVLEAIKGTPRGKGYYEIFSLAFRWWMAGCSAKDPVVATFKAHQQAFVNVVAATSSAQAVDRFSVLVDEDDGELVLTPDVASMDLEPGEPYVLSQIGRAFWMMRVGPQRALVVQRADSPILSVMVRRDQQDVRALLRLPPGLGYYTRFPLHGDRDVASRAIQMSLDLVEGRDVDMDLFNQLVDELEEARKAHEAAVREADEQRREAASRSGDRRPRRHERPSKPAQSRQPRNEGFNPQLREQIAALLPQLKAQLAALQG